ncbi:MAG: type II secretion system protein GspL [Gammaproteobacteria bacterium]
MTTKVYLRFINENQWVGVCEAAQDGMPLDMLDDLMVEWTWSDGDHPVQPPAIVSFQELAAELQRRWPHSYQYGIDLVVSGAHTVGADVSIPTKQMRQIAQALPYMLEDQLAQDVSQFHLIYTANGNSGDISVLGIPQQLVAVTQRLFAEQNLPLDAIFADMLCLPLASNEWTLLADSKHLLIRHAELGGMSIEIDAAPVVLAAIFDNWEPKPATLRVMLCKEHLTDSLTNWIKTQINSAVADQNMAVEFDDIASDYFVVLCDRLQKMPRKHPANFLQGAFAAKGRRKPSGYNWKPLAALAASFVIVYTGYLYTQSWKYNAEAKRVEAEATSLYKRLFPQDRRIVNVKRQMEQHIKDFQKGQTSESFLALLTLTGQHIQTMNRTATDAIKPQRAAFDENQGDLRLDLQAKDFGQLENFKTRLESASLLVETASAAQDAGVVKARLKIRSQGS